MNRRTVMAQLLVFGLIAVVVVSFAVFQLLHVRILDRPYPLTVQLRTAGGVFEDAEVTYRGVAVGRVDDLRLHTDHVTLTLSIDDGVRIPSNSVVRISDLSAVGEQYVNFDPGPRPASTYYRAGDVIPYARTSVPLRTAAVLYDLERFVSSVDARDLQIIGREGAAAFRGTGPQLKSLITGTSRLVNELSSTQDAAIRLIRNSALLLHDAAGRSGEFDRFARSLRSLSGTLASATPDLTGLLESSVPTTQLIDQLIRSNAGALSVLLADTATLSQIQVARVPGLQSLLVSVPTFGRLAPKVVVNGVLNGIVQVDRNDPVCATNVPLTSPISGKRTPLVSVDCPGSLLARGAANAPRPGGSAQSAHLSALPSADGSVQVSSYDVRTGLTSTADGQVVRLGLTGGQDRVLGPNSWQALLLSVAGG